MLNLNKYINNSTVAYDDTLANNNPKDNCINNPNAVIYMQYACMETTSQLNIKREQGLFISCCACFAALFWLIVVWYL